MSTKKIYKAPSFIKRTKKSELDDAILCKAIDEVESGLVDADLGGNVYKKRIPLQGRGKRGGARTIIAGKFNGVWFFLYAFAKNEKDNITKRELKAFQKIAHDYLGIDSQGLRQLLDVGELEEVIYNEQDPKSGI